MSKFTGDLKVDFTDAGTAVLLEPLVWECDVEGSDLVATVPAGFRSDGATVPRFLWALLPPWGDRATRAAILHDYLCEVLMAGHPNAGAKTRAACDRQFRLALVALGVVTISAWGAWIGVRSYSILFVR